MDHQTILLSASGKLSLFLRPALNLMIVYSLLLLTILPSAAAEELPAAITRFVSQQSQPVFSGRPGHWDARIRERGWIIRDADVWHLWYTGYDPDQQPPIMRLGYATSNDGLQWTRYSDQPLIDDLWVEDMMVIRHQDRWLMFAEGRNDQAQLLTSPNGIDWTRLGTLDIRLKNGEPIPPGPFGTPTAYFEDGIWNLFYERRDAGIWLARSTDMVTWTNVDDQPVIIPGPDSYDSLMIAMNQIVRLDDRYLAVLHGTGTPEKPREWCTTFAVSRDLRHWTKYGGNPVLPIPENKSSGLLIHDGKQWRLYTMHDRVDVHWSQPSGL